jgi:2-oxo-4-hydroxy-4-carboxy--5-ureidoimidazoline (OHCU) decarboxylase
MIRVRRTNVIREHPEIANRMAEKLASIRQSSVER